MHQQFKVQARTGQGAVSQTVIVDESKLFQKFSELIEEGECDEIFATSPQFNYYLVLDYLDHWEIACSYKDISDAQAHFPDLLEVGSNNPDGSPKYF